MNERFEPSALVIVLDLDAAEKVVERIIVLDAHSYRRTSYTYRFSREILRVERRRKIAFNTKIPIDILDPRDGNPVEVFEIAEKINGRIA